MIHSQQPRLAILYEIHFSPTVVSNSMRSVQIEISITVTVSVGKKDCQISSIKKIMTTFKGTAKKTFQFNVFAVLLI